MVSQPCLLAWVFRFLFCCKELWPKLSKSIVWENCWSPQASRSVPFCRRGAAERQRWPGGESESSHQGGSAGLGRDVQVELQPGKASLSPLPVSWSNQSARLGLTFATTSAFPNSCPRLSWKLSTTVSLRIFQSSGSWGGEEGWIF